MYDKEVQANRPERGRPEDDTHPQGADAWIPRHTLTTRDRVQTGDGPQGPGGWNPAGAIRRAACLEAHTDEQGLASSLRAQVFRREGKDLRLQRPNHSQLLHRIEEPHRLLRRG